MIETDRGEDFLNKILTHFLNKNKIKRYFSKTSVGVVFAGTFKRTIGDLPKRPVCLKGGGNWTDVLRTLSQQYNNRIHSSTKLTPMKAPSKKNEGVVYQNY